jgi:hypothetical protein
MNGPMVQVFFPYESKPVTRYARRIEKPEEIAMSQAEPNTYWLVTDFANPIRFKAYETPQVGDWVVRLTEDDTYHCTDAVFRERNIVPDVIEQ